MIQLYPEQAECQERVFAAWRNGARNVLMVYPTGGGKTVICADTVTKLGQSTVAIAHRQEIVSQMSLAFARNEIRHRIIGPAAVASNCRGLHLAELGKNYVDPSNRVAVAGVDTLIRMGPTDWFNQVGLIVQDECFVEGTLVDGKPIETLQVGDKVTAFDEHNKTFHLNKITKIFKNPIHNYMMRVTVNHHVIECTLGHPFFTKRGWVNAGELSNRDEVILYEMYDLRKNHRECRGNPTLPLQKNRADLLPKILWDAKSKKKVACIGERHMFDVWRNNFKCRIPSEGEWKDLLLKRMLKEICFRTIINHNGPNQPKTCFSKNARQQPNVSRGMCSQGICIASSNGPQTKNSRGEWETSFTRRNSSLRFVQSFGICYATSNKNRKIKRRISALLQTRLRTLAIENSLGSGRIKSQPTNKKNSRPEERGVPKWVGVDCVEIYKPSDIDATNGGIHGSYVYNIEVEGLHTYIANGIVVHNCHHLLVKNKWGKVHSMFPNALGLGVTATPCRADGHGLGKHADGVMEAMVEGPTMRNLIERGKLTDYRIFAPPSDLQLDDVPLGADGDYSKPKLATAVHKSHIVGDVVAHYLRIAPGKRGITFAVDVSAATEIAQAFRDAGVPAEVVTAKTPDHVRAALQRKLRAGSVLMLVNVDLFGEGVDIPAVEVVIMARPTASYSLYCQQFGRALRKMLGKMYAIIIDHVGNVHRHGLPDRLRTWTLDRRDRKAKNTSCDEPVRTCPGCLSVYEAYRKPCPYCGYEIIPGDRSKPEFVAGDLFEVDPEVLARMRGVIEAGPTYPYGATPAIVGALNKHHGEKIAARSTLRDAMARWAGKWSQATTRDAVSELQRRFYYTFGVDVATAQTLNRKDTEELTLLIERA